MARAPGRDPITGMLQNCYNNTLQEGKGIPSEFVKFGFEDAATSCKKSERANACRVLHSAVVLPVATFQGRRNQFRCNTEQLLFYGQYHLCKNCRV